MGAKGVQFRGIKSVINAFDNAGLTDWAIFYDKNICAKYSGAGSAESRATLEAFLALLAQSSSTAVYTLNLYEDLPKGAKIKASTEPDYGFNFTIYSDLESESPYHSRQYGQVQILTDKVTQLEAQLMAKTAELEDGPQEVGGISGLLNGILSDDRAKAWIQTKVFEFADGFFKKPAPAMVMPMHQDYQAATVGAVDETKPYVITEDQNEKIEKALEILARIDDKLGDHLLKLSEIAKNDPGKYMMLSKML